MVKQTIRAFWLGNEINLELIAKHFGIARRSRWEDFLALGSDNLKGVIPDSRNRQAHLFPFGCIVVYGMEHHEISDLVSYLRRVEPSLSEPLEQFSDQYQLGFGTEKNEIRNDGLSVTSIEDWTSEIVSTVLSKSVALEKIESEIITLLNEAEPILELMKKGKVNPNDHAISHFAARILMFRLETVAYIQLLDKPDATWDNPKAEELYNPLALFFELHDRYEKIQSKSEVLMDIAEVVTTFGHHRRGIRLEWAVIILIAVEIVLSLLSMFVLKTH